MENGEYYMGIGANADPNSPTLIVGYRLDGIKIEICKSRETYVVVNTKTEKFLTCLGFEHARYVIRTNPPALT